MAAASIRDVAARAQVSVGTVSNVLNRESIVSPQTAARVHAAIEELGFVRNDAARQLRAGKSRSIGLAVIDMSNPFFTDLARGAEDLAAEHGMAVLVGNMGSDSDRESMYLDLFEEQRVFGVLASPLGDNLERLERLRLRGTPVVLVDRRGEGTEFSSVSVDDVAGGALAINHLLSIGRRRIVFVGGPPSLRQVSDRIQGAQEAIAQYPDATLELIPTDSLSVLEGRAAGFAILARPPAERPDAIFAANDLVATGLLQSISIVGRVAVPQEIAIIGYDDIDFASVAAVPLSSISQPAARLGSRAVELLIERADGRDRAPEHVLFQPELVVRQSSSL